MSKLHKSLFLLFASCLIVATACNSDEQSVQEEEENPTIVIEDSASWLIAQAIEAHGGAAIDSSEITFTFRNRSYRADRTNGEFEYERSQEIEGKTVVDKLNSQELVRTQEGEVVSLSAKDSASYARSVNSVIYFALLPYNLQDPAVNPKYLGQVDFSGKSYHKLQVTFSEDGGGRDFEDVYMYWFDVDNFSLDYLAYNFLVDNGGARFRKAYNLRSVEGIRFADYLNMKPQEDYRDVSRFDSLYEAGGLDSLSLIVLENVQVQ